MTAFRTMMYMLIIAVGSLNTASLCAQSPELDALIGRAVEHNPELKAVQSSIEAGAARIPQAGALPDPRIAAAWLVSPVETRVGAQRARLSLSQSFPWFGTTGLETEKAHSEVEVQRARYRQMQTMLQYRVRTTYVRIFEAERKLALLARHDSLLATLEHIVKARYISAQSRQVDILQIQLERENLAVETAELREARTVHKHRLCELIAEDCSSGIELRFDATPQFRLDTEAEPELFDTILEQNPNLQVLMAEQTVYRSRRNLAAVRGLPSFMLGAEYTVVEQRPMDMPDNGKDVIGLTFSMNLPVFRETYRAGEREAVSGLQAAEERSTALRNKLQTDLSEALRDLRDARRREQLYGATQRRKVEQMLDIMQKSYASAEYSFSDLLRIQQMLLRYENEFISAETRVHAAIARVWELMGK